MFGGCAHPSLRPVVTAAYTELSCPFDGTKVFLVGDFNGWQSEQPMQPEGRRATQRIEVGPGEYAYGCRYADGVYLAPPDADAYSDDGFGGKNAWLRVPEQKL